MTEKPIRIPFDSLCLVSVVAEAQEFVGGKIQGVRQPTDSEVSLGIYHAGREAMLLLSCHPIFARAHFITRRPANQPQPPAFCQALRARLDGATIVAVRQIGFDRILHIESVGAKGSHLLIAEIMGKHSNLILLGEEGRVVSMAKAVGRSKSSRPILSGIAYEPPPLPVRPSLMDASEGDDLKGFEGASPFLQKLIAAMGPGALQEIQARVQANRYDPCFATGHGAYPVPVDALGVVSYLRPSISIALEQHFQTATLEQESESLRQSLLGQLNRVLLAREVAIADLEQAVEKGAKAASWQLWGDLILAYGHSIQDGQSELLAWDYEGTEVRIKLDPELGWKENAQRYFERAKKSKSRLGSVHEQIGRLSKDREDVLSLIDRVKAATRLDHLKDLKDEGTKHRWLNLQSHSGKARDERPYEGHRIREVLGPQGWTILYGENAESNDYLTLRVAKPNDWWIHIRGSVSAHVVIPTQNKPEKVSPEVIRFAAKIAVQNSPSKHSGYVPVDYTLKRYVRKPRGAPKGTALYTHEKTLHIEG